MLLCFLVMAAVVVADQASKLAAVAFLAERESVTLVPGIMDLSYLENRGAAFGMLADHRWIFMVLSVAAIIAMTSYLILTKPESRLQRVSIALIAGGGIGNMIDRVARGYVVDFFEVTLFDFYVFNIADSAVCIGCGLLILWMILSEAEKPRKKARDNAD